MTKQRKGPRKKKDRFDKVRKGAGPSKQRSSMKAYQRDKDKAKQNIAKNDGLIRLNKYLADAGVSSRREADQLIQSGAVKVNGKVVKELGTKVKVTDKVQYGEETLKRESLVYVLLNKPKDYITTTEDPKNRKTVMSLVDEACKERIYPVGRLDRNTTGLLLFTNDGDMAKQLLHPRHKVKKLYHVELDQPLAKKDLEDIARGVKLEEGRIQVDGISYDVTATDKRNVGISIHSGQNRVVRRIFQSFGYEVEKLDRTIFGPLTKKNLPRGKWRYLTDEEILMLKKF
ncbi:MAG: rRNA pseudouridine synthase [Bacteroidales bacterium]|nr:rRNA pseudouridine synthase [Bacteroidales bacterium]MCF8334952.1 rRNA pseudouridine synthase [Bacteroidales bacterium]